MGFSFLKMVWEEQDSNLRRFPNGFTVRPRWPLEYLPGRANITTVLGFANDWRIFFDIILQRFGIEPYKKIPVEGILNIMGIIGLFYRQ